MIDLPSLSGSRIVLRRPEPRDAGARLALGNDPGIMRMLGADPRDLPEMNEIAAQRWLDALLVHPFAWAIEHDGRLLGEIRLDALDRHDGRAQLAIGFYDPARLGMGLGREAIRLVARHAFGVLGLHRIGLRVVAYNTRAIRCYRACGFVVEGREREAAYVAGERHDDVVMGLLAHEFPR
ncbi:MAG: GNAT family protein [Roseiarcus sp.]|jgi:RimJ/RimL family protein N-acetyltransferase